MKKNLILFTLLFSPFLLSAKAYNTSINFVTGIPYYSNSSSERENLLSEKNHSRYIGGLSADLQLNATEPVKFFFCIDTFCDFLHESNQYFNSIDYSAGGGIRIYPNLQGLNFSISYLIGNRSDFINTTETSETKLNSWGNGFKIDLNYDFLHKTKYSFMPNIGISYKNMPRGNFSRDHIFSAYLGIKF